MRNTQTDFRVAFARMADVAIVTRDELAELLSTTPAALSQMNYRGELPTTAFPEKRKACWFVRDVRRWLEEAAAAREQATGQQAERQSPKRVGRPRHASDLKGER